MQTVINLFRNNIREYGMIIALVFITGLFLILTDGITFKPLNLTNLILQNGF
ncbi:sugar ABC transporter permease, partial [Bacillus haikouensis]|nr:sugar ABC transporter permease [Bacillus haikouensis]